jgi:hypothetical protein
MEAFFFPIFSDFRKSTAFWKVPRLRLFVLLVREHVDEDEYGALVE